MITKGKVLCAAGLLIAAGIALGVGVSLSTIFLFGVSLLCPAVMFFGMHGGGACHHKHERGQAEKDVPENSSKTLDVKRVA